MNIKQIILAGDPNIIPGYLSILQDNTTALRFPDFEFKHLDELLPLKHRGKETGLIHFIQLLEKDAIRHPKAIIWGPHQKDKPDFFENLVNINYGGNKVLLYLTNYVKKNHGQYADKFFHPLNDGYIGNITLKLKL
ncbi:MAG: hypothetical protein KC589_04440 [Nanoarchaeota archaeon]|nr:hypothetical protein [Nanoarchaeota archaeon]